MLYTGGGGQLPEKLDGNVGPLPKPLPFYGQNLRFFLPYLWPDQSFDTLLMTITKLAQLP